MFTTTASALNAYAMIALSFRAAGAVLVAAVLLLYDRITWKQCAIVYLFGALLNLFLEVPDFTSALLLLIEIFVATLALANIELVVWFKLTASRYGLLFDYQGYALEIIRAYNK